MTIVEPLEVGGWGSPIAEGIVDGPGGYTGIEGDDRWAAEIRRLATARNAPR